MSILAGFEVPTGRRFEIPDTGHLAWFGQTQLSGKTTALEAFAFRGGLRAVAFITKQGEGGFLTGKMIPPYFSEPTNDEEQPLWRWVKSILEASQMRRMNFEESWVIRACEDPRPAKTLADVHQNIKDLLSGEKGLRYTGKRKGNKTETKWIRKPVSGINAGVYTSLKAYFDIVMPQLARLPYVKKLELHPGVNVMDLRDYAMETQSLVIRSVLEWVYLKEKNVRVIIPEAQDFVPQGKNSPVKMAVETLVRKGGANKNFMWLDGQDMAAVDKFALRACSVVGIGVQTEAHEIDRSLATMFTPTLKPIDIARLKIGEFFVRTPEARVSKIYVQPCWMESELHAQAIAKGEESVSSARQMLTAFKNARKVVSEKSSSGGKPHQLLQIQTQEREENEKPGKRDHGTEGLDIRSEAESDSDASVRSAGAGTEESEDEETMWREKFEALDREHRTLIEAHDALAAEVRQLRADIASGATIKMNRGARPADPLQSNEDLNAVSKTENGHGLSLTVPQLAYIYKFVKASAEKDAGILELLAARPELRVKVGRPVISFHQNDIEGRIALLITKQFFSKPKPRLEIGRELVRIGVLKLGTNMKILSSPLNRLTEMGFLTLEPDGFQSVPGMKVMKEK